MAQYMLLIHTIPGHWESLSEEERNALYQDYVALSRDLTTQGKVVSAHELQPAATGKAVRVRSGKTLVTDGPFAETKEAVGGYYLIEADSFEEAVEWAERIPSAHYGTIEVRPVVPREAPVDLSAARSSQ